MKHTLVRSLAALLLTAAMLSGCGAGTQQDNSSKVATADEMTDIVDVVEDWMEPVTGDKVKDGIYDVTVDCSSDMFRIESAELTAQDGNLTAILTMGGTGYLYVYMGTGEEAVAASEEDYIPFVETDGVHTFEIPVEALDKGIACTAFSKREEKWYDRTLVFRADSLPVDAFAEGVLTTAESLSLSDGNYTAEVELTGGSGKASVDSPAVLHVKDGKVTAEITWSSPNYDYMIVSEEKFLPVNTEGNSCFEIPVEAFDWRLPVRADTTAMSQPHEISYTLRFDSGTLTEKQ